MAIARDHIKIMGLFCRISSLFKGSFAKETYNFKEPTNRSHPIWLSRETTLEHMSNQHIYIYIYIFSNRESHLSLYTQKRSHIHSKKASIYTEECAIVRDSHRCLYIYIYILFQIYIYILFLCMHVNVRSCIYVYIVYICTCINALLYVCV